MAVARQVQPGPPLLRPRGLVLALLGLLSLRLIIKVTGAAGLTWDFVGFYATGIRVWSGELTSLYASPAGIAGLQQYVGFPITAYLFAPLGPLDPRTALLIFKAVCAACIVLGVLTLWRESLASATDGHPATRRTFHFLLILGLFEPLWFVFNVGGQSTAFAFLLLVLFMRYYLGDRITLASVCLVAAVLIKPFLILVLPVFLIGRQDRLGACVAVVLLSACLLSIGLLGWPLHVAWARVVLQESSRYLDLWWMNNAPAGFLTNLWNYVIAAAPTIGVAKPPLLFLIIQGVYRLALVASVGWLAWVTGRAGVPERTRRHRLLLLGVVFAMCFPTIVWPYYNLCLVVPLVPLVAQIGRLSRGARGMLMVITLLLLHPELSWQFALGYPWRVPSTVLVTLLDSVLTSGAALLLPVFLWIFRSEVLLTEPEATPQPA